MQQLSMPDNETADAAFLMNGDYMSPFIRRGEIIKVEWKLPAVGECALFRLGSKPLVRQYCEDSFGNIYLFVLDRSQRAMDVSVPSGTPVVCLGRLILEKTPPLPLD